MARKKDETTEKKEKELPIIDPKVVEESVENITKTGKKVIDEFMKISGDVQNLGTEIASITGTTGLKQNENIINSIRKTAEQLLSITSGATAETMELSSQEVKDISKSLETIAGSATALFGASSDVARSSANLGLNLFKNSLLLLKEMENLLGGVIAIGGNTLSSLGEFLEAIGKLGRTSGDTVQALGTSLQG